MLLEERRWYRLNETNAGRLPEAAGVYELGGRGAVVVFIGWAGPGELRARVRAHVKDPRNTCIAANAFFFRFELPEHPESRAAALVEEYRRTRYGTLPECMRGNAAPAAAPAAPSLG